MLTVVVFLSLFCFQIRDFHIAEREEDIGSYAGYVGELMFNAFSSLLHSFFSFIFSQTYKPNTMLKIFEGSAFMLGRALTSVSWGIFADRYGRKPVIIMGTTSVLVKLLS